jgi:hypothetical protein
MIHHAHDLQLTILEFRILTKGGTKDEEEEPSRDTNSERGINRASDTDTHMRA